MNTITLEWLYKNNACHSGVGEYASLIGDGYLTFSEVLASTISYGHKVWLVENVVYNGAINLSDAETISDMVIKSLTPLLDGCTGDLRSNIIDLAYSHPKTTGTEHLQQFLLDHTLSTLLNIYLHAVADGNLSVVCAVTDIWKFLDEQLDFSVR